MLVAIPALLPLVPCPEPVATRGDQKGVWNCVMRVPDTFLAADTFLADPLSARSAHLASVLLQRTCAAWAGAGPAGCSPGEKKRAGGPLRSGRCPIDYGRSE